MLRSRIIPCLLIRNKGLVKTVRFKDGKYVGDPLNAVRIFNEKSVDELMVLDIDATVKGSEPNYKVIKDLARECRMPLCYGGGVATTEQAIRISHLGVEKIAVSSSAFTNPELISEMSAALGSQSVVVVLDVKKNIFGTYEIYTHNGTKKVKVKLEDAIKDFELRGAGEIVINSIDLDGMMTGYDIKLIQKVRDSICIPLTVLGGAGHLDHVSQIIKKFKLIGVAAGSLFVFKGKYKAVLINYPSKEEKRIINQVG